MNRLNHQEEDPSEKRTLPAEIQSGVSGFRIPTPIALVALAILALLIYSDTFSSPFHFDDSHSISKNPKIRDLSNFLALPGPRYIAQLSFALNYQFGGLNVFGYHCVNLSIHILNGFLVYALVLLFYQSTSISTASGMTSASLSSRWIAFAVALLFISHPIQTQAVTYIVQRYASLAALFYLIAIACYLKWRLHPKSSTGRGVWYIAAILSTLLAMKTKENSFTIPLMLLLIETTLLGPIKRKVWIGLIPFILMLAIIPYSHPEALMDDGSGLGGRTQEIGRSDYLFTQFRVMMTYLRLLILPIHQNLDYDYPLYTTLGEFPVFLSLLFLLSLTGLAIYLVLRPRLTGGNSQSSSTSGGFVGVELRLIGFGILWFFLTLSVESSVIPLEDVIFEHRLYLPSIGFLLSLLLVIRGTLDRFHLHPRSLFVLLALIILTFSIAAFQRNRIWKDEVTLWRDVVEKSPHKVRARYNLAEALQTARRPKESVEQYLMAVKINPKYAKAYYNLAAVYLQLDSPTDAIDAYERALMLRPKAPEVHNNLANVLASQGRFSEAIKTYKKALVLRPNKVNSHFNLAIAYSNLGRQEEAILEYKTTLDLDPNFILASFNLGALYAQRGRIEEAKAYFENALRIKPDFQMAQQALRNISQQHTADP